MIFLSLFVVGCRHPSENNVPTREDIRRGERPSQESWGVRFDVQEGAHPRVHIVAGYMARIEHPDSTYLLLRGNDEKAVERVTAYLFDEAGDSSAVLVANEVYYYEDESRFETRGNVIIDTHDEKRLETEHLVWYETERIVRTPGFVRITTPKEQMQGYQLEADEDLEHYSLARVTGQVTVEEQ